MTDVRPRTRLAVSSERSNVTTHKEVSQLRSVLQAPAGHLKPHCYSNQVNQRKLTMVFMSQVGAERKPHQVAPLSTVCSIRSDDNKER
jgi:hypothetical protein